MFSSKARALFAVLLPLIACSCQPVKGGPVFDSVLLKWLSQNKAPAHAPALSVADRRKNEMGEILHEMFQVVLLREPSGSGEFDSLWNPLIQGASVEGIYNGMVHSSRYGEMERKTGRATTLALRIFSSEIGPLQAALAQPSDLGVGAARRTEDYQARFGNASLFTLKRVLGDEALKVINAKIAKPEELASWYGPWAARLAGMQVDFGLPLRNNPDPKFHERWLLAMMKTPGANGTDHVVWEVLNRVHRLLDVAEEKGLKVSER